MSFDKSCFKTYSWIHCTAITHNQFIIFSIFSCPFIKFFPISLSLIFLYSLFYEPSTFPFLLRCLLLLCELYASLKLPWSPPFTLSSPCPTIDCLFFSLFNTPSSPNSPSPSSPPSPSPSGTRQCGEGPDVVWPATHQKALSVDLHSHIGSTEVLLYARQGQRGLPHHDSTARRDGVCHRCPQTAPVWPHWQKPGKQEPPKALTQEVQKAGNKKGRERAKSWLWGKNMPHMHQLFAGSGLRKCICVCVFSGIFPFYYIRCVGTFLTGSTLTKNPWLIILHSTKIKGEKSGVNFSFRHVSAATHSNNPRN